MGFLSWLFGNPKTMQTPEELQALEEEKARLREESRKQTEQDIMWANMLDKAHRMVADYGGVMADLLARIFHKKAQTSCKSLIEWYV